MANKIAHTIVQPNPAQGHPGAQPTPLATGATPTLRRELPKLQPGARQKVAAVIRRKS
ncbi:hypothetical protein [Bradyrhizobium sp. SZCCHNS2015]|uniref:hypothetical protein n=1 Tax=Bradyrhizobium sp. SZCCHNS2015 TaxID=3057305 RepID=UPI0028E8AE6A|nr:hypothetical protein [Bradyrhizobium sp. SZCCHNS2015]